jgi:threonine dehydratase
MGSVLTDRCAGLPAAAAAGIMTAAIRETAVPAPPTEPRRPATPPAPFGLAEVEAAARRIAGAVGRTPFLESRTLGAILDCRLFLKFENLQFTASFKERGALNRLLALTPAERARGVVAMSAGNHAQGVAYHAQRLGIPATIVMPRGTPFVKVQHTETFGATVILEGAGLGEALAHARRLEAGQGLVFLHPYDDPVVAAGQGTVGLEMLDDAPHPLDAVIVPIGGGGLMAGVATAVKARAPEVEVIGVQTALYPAMAAVLGGTAPVVGGATIAEGIAVKEPGRMTREVIGRLVDDILLVSEDALERAVVDLLTIEKTVVEGAGAAPLAALREAGERFRGRTVALVLSGGNMDQRLLASVLLRDLVRSGRMARLRIALADTPGALAGVAALIGEAGGNIVDVSHQRTFSHLPAKQASLEVAVETMDAAALARLVETLRTGGYAVDLLDGL